MVNITTGGAPYMTVEERVKPAAKFKPEVASLNMGSMNFGLFPMLNRFKEFKHDWERPSLENSRDLIFRNTFKDIEFVLTTCADNGTRFEFECYDIGHLYNLAHFLDRGLVKPPLFVQTRVRHSRRHRRPSGGRDAHEAHRRPPVRRATTTGRCSAPAATRCRSRRRRRDGRQRARRA